ncbi:Mesaconyl-C(4)-CoA hydratase [Fusarium oxysporum f. sp. albedinis]|nr:Mesaconyl-C(4)-CoA hydratase [Fusarium oxysporum f. sp. albedinis]
MTKGLQISGMQWNWPCTWSSESRPRSYRPEPRVSACTRHLRDALTGLFPFVMASVSQLPLSRLGTRPGRVLLGLGSMSV